MNKIAILFTIVLLTSILIMPIMAIQAQSSSPTFQWSIEMTINDLEVSQDGDYIVAVNDTGLYYFSSADSNPIWWWLADSDYPVISVAISAKGNYVAVGTRSLLFPAGYLGYFGDANNRIGEQSAPTWKTNLFGDPVYKASFDMSEDGKYIAIGGSGEELYYFADCTTRAGPAQTSTWSNTYFASVEAVAISSDGKHVAVGGSNMSNPNGFVAFYENAYHQPYPTGPEWLSDQVTAPVTEIDLSENALPEREIEVSALTFTKLYYWSKAGDKSGNPAPDWTYLDPEGLTGIDAAQNIDSLIAFTGPLRPDTLYFWAQGSTRTLGTPDWLQLEGIYVSDGAISADGTFIAALTNNALIGITTAGSVNGISDPDSFVYFFNQDGNQIGQPYKLPSPAKIVSMSKNAETIATGGGIRGFVVAPVRLVQLPLPTSHFTVFKTQASTKVGGEIISPNTLSLIANQLYIIAPLLIAIAALFIAVLMFQRKIKKSQT